MGSEVITAKEAAELSAKNENDRICRETEPRIDEAIKHAAAWGEHYVVVHEIASVVGKHLRDSLVAAGFTVDVHGEWGNPNLLRFIISWSSVKEG